MSYFNHAYRKSFVGTKATQAGSGTAKAVDNGFLTAAGVHTGALSDTAAPNSLGVGTFGFFNPDTYLSVNASSAEVIAGKPLVLAASALFANDKIGPFHGGYKESNKSKMINPRFVHKFSKMTGAAAEQSIWHTGNTNWNSFSIDTVGSLTAGSGYALSATYTGVALEGGTGVGAIATVVTDGTGAVTSITITEPGQGYTVNDVLTLPASIPLGTGADITVTAIKYDAILAVDANASKCNFDFVCGETYNLRLDLWGSPVLRFLNHDLYKTLAASTGCCAEGALGVNVDSTLVMINWANQIINDVWLQHFIRPVVYTQTGVALFATAAEAVAAGFPSGNVWSTYVSPGYISGATAGLRFVTAYVDTKFGNCSFQTSDFVEKEVVQMNVSLTDLTGAPCEFSALCVNKEYAGFQGQGYGETILRDVILDESYLQNHFSNDVRIREITQGDQYFNAIPRLDVNGNHIFYTRYVIQHSVPRYNNPSGVYDNDQYALNIYVPAATATAFEAFMATWLGAAAVGGVVSLVSYGHTAYTPATL